MIEILNDFPDNVLALNAKGTITHDDYRQTVLPELENKREKHKRIRVLYHFGCELDDNLDKSFWMDMIKAFDTGSDFERMAVITDHRVIRLGVEVVGRYVSQSHRIYHEADSEEAAMWIKE